MHLQPYAHRAAAHLTSTIPELEKTIAWTTAKLRTARAASRRADTYLPHKWLCPKCWVEGIESPLVQIDSEHVSCRACRSEYPH